MASFSDMTWLALAAIAAAAVISMLHTLACVVRNESHLHDLKVECSRLRNRYVRRLQAIAAGEELGDPDDPDRQGEFDILD